MMSDILDAALNQNPIEFKNKFEEAVQAEILRQGEAVRAEILKSFSEAKDDEEEDESEESDKDSESDKESDSDEDSDKDDESDEDDGKKSNLTERTLSFEVGNPSSASKQLRSKGVQAASEPGSGKVVKVSVATPEDGRKVTAWLLDQGWSEKEVKQKYPELARLAKKKG
jgi:hypothetical protein